MGLFNRKPSAKCDIIKTKEHYEKTRDYKREDFSICPDWLEPEYDNLGNYSEEPDELYALFDPLFQKRILKEGKVAIGALVQANVDLFEKGKENLPAGYIYSEDPFFLECPGELLGLADALFQTKGESGYHPSIQKLADLLADEYERIFGYKLPRDLLDGKEVYFTTVVVDRNHLPAKKIEGRLYPMLVLPGEEPDAILLPHWHWKG